MNLLFDRPLAVAALTAAQCQTVQADQIPEGLTVTVEAVRVKTGKRIAVTEPAAKALQDLEQAIRTYQALLEHVQA